MSDTLKLARELISRKSVTPEDAGCQFILADKLKPLGFENTHLRFGEVDNLYARRGDSGPLFVFAGHTDVVPTGPEEDWQFPPFAATEDKGMLHGRGTADMKGSIAAMVTAVERFVEQYPDHSGSIGFLITSDEEGPATDGTVKVIDWLESRNEKIDWCLVGEPSSSDRVGDVIKNGRRGSLGAKLSIKGIQGHVAYPHLASNPIHQATALIHELVSLEWDQGNDHFPATTFQISNMNAGTGATNVIPGILTLLFNFRFSTEVTETELRQQVELILEKHKLDYTIEWTLSGNPFLTPAGKLVDAAKAAVSHVCSYETELSTSGGTSDGRFIAPTGAQIVELGPLNATIHQIDEHIRAEDLNILSRIYEQILVNLLIQD